MKFLMALLAIILLKERSAYSSLDKPYKVGATHSAGTHISSHCSCRTQPFLANTMGLS